MAKAVADLPESILYVSSAGNAGKKHYEADFRQVSGARHHDFGAEEGRPDDETIGFSISPYRSTTVLLQWSDAFDNPTSDYDLYIFNRSGLVASSAWHEPQAIEGVCLYNPNPFKVVLYAGIDSFSGPDMRLEMFFLGARAIEYPTIEGSIFGHTGVERVLAVGTISAEDAEEGTIAYYSSRGPARIDHPAVVNRPKTDIVAIDGDDVTGTGGFNSPFYGTSAAVPHVAGVAALLMSVNPMVTAPNARKALVKGNPTPGLRMLLEEAED